MRRVDKYVKGTTGFVVVVAGDDNSDKSSMVGCLSFCLIGAVSTSAHFRASLAVLVPLLLAVPLPLAMPLPLGISRVTADAACCNNAGRGGSGITHTNCPLCVIPKDGVGAGGRGCITGGTWYRGGGLPLVVALAAPLLLGSSSPVPWPTVVACVVACVVVVSFTFTYTEG